MVIDIAEVPLCYAWKMLSITLLSELMRIVDIVVFFLVVLLVFFSVFGSVHWDQVLCIMSQIIWSAAPHNPLCKLETSEPPQ